MFKAFLTVLAQRITGFLIANPDFFKLNEHDKKSKLEELKTPAAFRDYLLAAKEEDIIADFKLILQFAQSSKKPAARNNNFFKAFLEFLTKDLARKVDYLDGDFYLLDTEHRQMIVDKLIQADSALASTLKDVLMNFTYQQIAAEVYEIGSNVGKMPYVLVQSPQEIDVELKREIRTQLAEKYPNSFPVFQINKKIIGGIRVFQDGETIDQSWLSRVLSFTSLTSA